MKRILMCAVVAGLAAVSWGQDTSGITLAAIKEIQIKRGSNPLCAEILAELANKGTAALVIKDSVFSVRFARPGFNPVVLEAAEPSDEVELPAGSAVKPGRAIVRILVNIGTDAAAADRVMELFNMISRRDKSSDLKVVLDGRLKVAQGGGTMSFAEREVRLEMVPEAGKSEALLR